MIEISKLKAKVKGLVEDITHLPAFYDVVPVNVKTGSLIVREATEFTGRTIDGDAHIAHHSFEIFIYSFESAEVADELTSLFVAAVDGKSSQDFRLIEVNSITPTEYDADSGFWSNAISVEFIEYGKK